MPDAPPTDDSALPDLSHAQIPPKVSAWWERTCWVFFVLGVIAVMTGLTIIIFAPDHKQAQLCGATLVSIVMWLAFPLAAANTFCASKRFDRRKNRIMKLISECPVNKERRKDFIVKRLKGTVGEADPISVLVGRNYQPKPYRQVKTEGNLPFSLKQYVDLIEAEVHGARVAAGRLAAALGGLFVAALQVYGKFAS